MGSAGRLLRCLAEWVVEFTRRPQTWGQICQERMILTLMKTTLGILDVLQIMLETMWGTSLEWVLICLGVSQSRAVRPWFWVPLAPLLSITRGIPALIAVGSAVELNGETFEAGIAGKAAFVKFLAPW